MAEIVDRVGNIFTSSCDAIAVTVNCVGDMGAGIALEARYRYPEMYARYRDLCESGELQPGRLWLWRGARPWVLCFPTKKHWRQPSRMEYVTSGLDNLADTHAARNISSIALPHLGSSHGGLPWEAVRAEIYDRLRPLPDLQIELWDYDPQAVDPWFTQLRERFGGASPDRIAEELGLRPQASRVLASVLGQKKARNLGALHRARGLGPRSLEQIYGFLFADGSPDEQLAFPFEDPV